MEDDLMILMNKVTVRQKKYWRWCDMYDILKVYEVDFWWRVVIIYIIYCIAIVVMIICHLRLNVIRRSACKPVIGFTSTEASICSVENPNILVLLLKAAENLGTLASQSYLDGSIIGEFSEHLFYVNLQFFGLANAHSVFSKRIRLA
jgi:hypothetical protein